MKNQQFVHLNVHSHYSLYNGISTVKQLVDAAIKEGMPGIAITDYGNMFGIMEFIDYVSSINEKRKKKKKKPFKPIIGCELYVAKHGPKEKKEGIKDIKGYHLTVLAKNLQGYKNLVKIVSNAWTDGFYASPRTDRMDLEKYHEGLIVLSGGWGSEVYTQILKGELRGVDDTIQWYRRVFRDDYYLELQRCTLYDIKRNNPSRIKIEQEKVNDVLIQKSKELDVKLVATNTVCFADQEDYSKYNVQQCIVLGKTMEEYEKDAPLEFLWLTSKYLMNHLFSEVPVAISNTMEIFDKVEFYDIHHAPIIPPYTTPKGFSNDAEYLEYLTFHKAKVIFGDPIPEDIVDKLQFELEVINKNGAERYFLFMQDVVNTAEKELGALVGPGRGTAAGSLVAFCLGITKIDPLKHDLLFERFMCPNKRIVPDIDLDFDEEGRTRVIEWLEKKYGKENFAHIVSFSKSSAKELEGIIQGLGVHACGLVISENPISDWAPVCIQEDPDVEGKNIRCTQYDGRTIEETGLMKFDFINHHTLSLLKAICERIKANTGRNIDIEKIPINDQMTFELFQQGKTEDVFLYGTRGMQHYLRKLHPTTFKDLVILNVMYRPGMVEDLPSLIKRKKGKCKISYAIPTMEKYLHKTYGIVIYQEQVMMLCRLLSDFTRGESDTLREALCKKEIEALSVLKPKFIEGGLRNGHKKFVLEKIWKDWEEKGLYLFNKAHAVCYSWLGYQMAYLKAHYPDEFSAVINESEINN
jgi:DNA polymerase-3 subunit alpha